MGYNRTGRGRGDIHSPSPAMSPPHPPETAPTGEVACSPTRSNRLISLTKRVAGLFRRTVGTTGDDRRHGATIHVYDPPTQYREYRLRTVESQADDRPDGVVAMSAQTRQQTLNGVAAPRRRGEAPAHAKRGYATILWRAPPATEWQRIAAWCRRAEAEGVI